MAAPRLREGQASGAGGGYGGGRFGTWGGAAADSANSAPTRTSTAQTLHGFRVGQSVRHAKFGEGVIVKLEGGGSDARAKINFGPHGIKELALAIAKLTRPSPIPSPRPDRTAASMRWPGVAVGPRRP